MFIKFPSIENHYNTKFITRFKNLYPEIENETFVILEKLHGTNLQLVFVPNNKDNFPTFCSRKKILSPEEDFYGLNEFKHTYIDVFSTLQKYSTENNTIVRTYGEYFGGRIQKNIDYGKDKKIRFFGHMLNEETKLRPFNMLEQFMCDLGLSEYIVPIMHKVSGIDAAINFGTEIPTIFSPENPKVTEKNPNNLIEGIVIAPYEKVITDNVGKFFMLKKKNSWAFEKENKSDKPKKELPQEVLELKNLFNSYINENRIYSVFSKEGEIKDQTEFGKYIKLVIEDAKEDFIKDNGEECLSNIDGKDIKQIFNAGNKIVEILKTCL